MVNNLSLISYECSLNIDATNNFLEEILNICPLKFYYFKFFIIKLFGIL